MANLWYTLNGQKLFPELPADRGKDPIRRSLDMASGNRRHYTRPTKSSRRRWNLSRRKVDAATRATWETAAAMDAAISLIDPDGVTYTVVVISFTDSYSKTTPAAGLAGSATATGDLFFDVAIELEQV